MRSRLRKARRHAGGVFSLKRPESLAFRVTAYFGLANSPFSSSMMWVATCCFALSMHREAVRKGRM